MTDSQAPRGVKRVRQACVNCRRKKTRCPGERPICSFCHRLQQRCEYDDDPRVDLSFSAYQVNPNDVDTLAARLFQIESRLNDMSRTTQLNLSDNLSAIPSQDYPQDALTTALSLELSAQSKGLTPPGSAEFASVISIHDLPKLTRNRLIDDYFRYSHNQPYSFFHEDNFRHKMAIGTLPDYLLEVVIMSALRFSTDQYFNSDMFFTNKRKAIADAFSRTSWKYLSNRYIDGEDDCSVSVVQAITLLAVYEFVEGRQRGAWVKIGIAAKFAQDLRLMFEPAASLAYSEQEEYRRAFWSIYLLDRLMTCGRGRPPVFPDASIIVSLPCSEDAFRSSEWEQSEELDAYLSDRVLQSPQPAPFARVIIASALLSRCSQYSIQAQRDSKNLPPWDVKSQYTFINSCLLYLESHADWQHSVTDLVKDCHQNLNATELLVVSQALHHLCYCILNHYFLVRQKQSLTTTRFPYSFYFNSLQVGLHHAQGFTRVLRSALETGHMVISSFLSYSCLVTATIHAVYRHSDFVPVQEQAVKDLEFNLSFLQRQSQYWPNSVTILNRLNDFCNNSLAYKELIGMAPELADVSQVDADRMYSLLDYSIMSNSKDVAVWPQVPSPDSTQ